MGRRRQNHNEAAVTAMHDYQLTSSQAALVEYLKELDFQLISPIINGEVSMRGKVATDGVTFDTIISLPPNVPPSYPRFYIVNSGLELREAHVERPNEVIVSNDGEKAIVCRTCVRDDRDKSYSASPVDLLHHLFVDFQGLCSKIARHEFDSKEEIFREFDSYWCNDYTIYWYLQNEPTDEALIDQIAIEYDIFLSSGKPLKISFGIVTDRPNEIIEFAMNAGWRAQKQKTIYIDVGDAISLPLPYTYGDMAEILEKSGKLDPLKRIRKQITSKIVYLGFNLNDTKKHYIGVGMKTINAIGGRNSKQGKGNSDSLTILFSSIHRKVSMTGSHIKLIDYNWLMRRGGSIRQSEQASLKKRVAIIGCGSVGGALAFKLSKSGIADFVLIDPEILLASNIGRHQLGMSFVGDYKARAMSRYLSSQFIGLSAKYHCGYIESPEAFSLLHDVDLVISAIGSDAPAVEPWLAELASNGKIPNLVTCWLEADGIAGHALQIKRGDKIAFDAACDSMNLLESVYASTLLESEVGCNSTYMPYGYIDADTHIGRMTHFIISVLHGDISYGMTSTGDISLHSDHLKRDISSWSYMVFNDETLSV